MDATAQVIVAAEITQETNDSRQLLLMLSEVEQNMGRKPQAVSADAGYWSEANVTDGASPASICTSSRGATSTKK